MGEERRKESKEREIRKEIKCREGEKGRRGGTYFAFFSTINPGTFVVVAVGSGVASNTIRKIIVPVSSINLIGRINDFTFP